VGTAVSDRRLVFVTQVMDPDDPVLGAVVGMVHALSERFERVTVIANECRRAPEGIEVVSLGKERGRGTLARGVAYERALARLFRRDRPDALLAHMCPVYLTAAAPLARPLGVKTMLWFAHPQDSRALRTAERLSDIVLTSMPGSYPRPGPKVRAIGQAVDLDRFPLAPPPPHVAGVSRLVALGRTSDSKRYDLAIEGVAAARAAGADVRLRIVGPSTTGREQQENVRLAAMIRTAGLTEAVTLEDGVPASQVPGLLAGSDALLNTTVDGSGDKAVFEAMASGRPVITSNPVFADLLADLPLALMFPTGDVPALGARLAELARAQPAAVAETGTVLAARVAERHSRAHWADQVHDVVDHLTGTRR
jgi:glycosyltransferase involved in cell wall biosynthesis